MASSISGKTEETFSSTGEESSSEDSSLSPRSKKEVSVIKIQAVFRGFVVRWSQNLTSEDIEEVEKNTPLAKSVRNLESEDGLQDLPSIEECLRKSGKHKWTVLKEEALAEHKAEQSPLKRIDDLREKDVVKPPTPEKSEAYGLGVRVASWLIGEDTDDQ